MGLHLEYSVHRCKIIKRMITFISSQHCEYARKMYKFLIHLNLLILVQCWIEEESARRLLRREGLIPKIINYAPKQTCKVVFQNKYEIQPGKEYTQHVISQQPTVTWPTENNTYYTLHVVGASDFQLAILNQVLFSETQPGIPRSEWNHWLVINIPGNKIHHGRYIYKWLEPEPPHSRMKVWYIFIIFKQTDLLVFNDEMPRYCYRFKKEFNPFTPTKHFMEYFRFKNESIVAVNFFVHKDARPTTSTINPTDLDLLWAIKAGKWAIPSTTIRTTTNRDQYHHVGMEKPLF